MPPRTSPSAATSPLRGGADREPIERCPSRAGRLCGVALWLAGCNFGPADPDPKPTPVAPPVVATATTPDTEPARASSWPADPRQVTVHDAAQLARLDLGVVEHLDLALSVPDRVGFIEEGQPEDGCRDLDLLRLATNTPRLKSLRVSGCDGAVQSGLGVFADRLEQLQLADMRLDGVVAGRLAQMQGLKQLSLRRVTSGTELLTPLKSLDLQAIRLSELEKDSDISMILDLWPRELRSVVLEGSWAGHKAMLTLAKADAVERLELRDTRIGNFSLNQIKPLSQLREVVFSGNTFNDSSPLYFRDLPVVSFTCECPRLGNAGLRSLRRSTGVRTLELRSTQITGEGLAEIADLTELESLTMTGVDLGSKGFAALAGFGRLRQLELSGELESPSLPHLGELSHLRVLRLGYPQLDDRAAPSLAALSQLEELDLGNSQLSDAGLEALATLTQLRILRLHHTRVTNRGLAALAKLSHLRVLELDHTDVVDAGIEHLRTLRSLEELRLDSTLVTDAAIDHLLELEGLRRLNLSHTVVTPAGAARLRALPNLEVLGLDGIRSE